MSRGPFELCKAAYPSMKARGGGAIINISSIGGLKPESKIGLYSSSKAALINLTQAMYSKTGGGWHQGQCDLSGAYQDQI
ncbi:MAG: SDR family oxidoreductase [Deinococcales bacterium]